VFSAYPRRPTSVVAAPTPRHRNVRRCIDVSLTRMDSYEVNAKLRVRPLVRQKSVNDSWRMSLLLGMPLGLAATNFIQPRGRDGEAALSLVA
jgi:hypothetical protein